MNQLCVCVCVYVCTFYAIFFMCACVQRVHSELIVDRSCSQDYILADQKECFFFCSNVITFSRNGLHFLTCFEKQGM